MAAWKELFHEARVKRAVEVGAAVFAHDQAIVGIGGFEQGREHHPTGSDTKQHQSIDAARGRIISRSVPAKALNAVLDHGDIVRLRSHTGWISPAAPSKMA